MDPSPFPSHGARKVKAAWLAAAVLVVWSPRPVWPAERARRLGRIARSGRLTRSPPLRVGSRLSGTRAPTIAAALVFFGSSALVGLPWGPVIGSILAVLVTRVIPRLETRAQVRDRMALAREVPAGIDVLSAALRAGMTDIAALRIVAEAVGEPLATFLGKVARARRLGADPATAWKSATAEPLLAPLAEEMIRSAGTGASVTPVLDRVAADARQRYFDEAQATVRSLSVRAVLPLGICYLPSFMLLSVVPVVAAFISGLRW